MRDPVALICCEDSFLAWIEAQLSRGVLKFLMTECQVREPAYDRVPQRKHPNLKHLQVFIPYSEDRLVVVYSFMCCHISLHRLYLGCYGVSWGQSRAVSEWMSRIVILSCCCAPWNCRGSLWWSTFFDLKDYASIYSAPGVIGLFEYENDVNHVAGFTQPRETVTGSISLE